MGNLHNLVKQTSKRAKLRFELELNKIGREFIIKKTESVSDGVGGKIPIKHYYVKINGILTNYDSSSTEPDVYTDGGNTLAVSHNLYIKNEDADKINIGESFYSNTEKNIFYEILDITNPGELNVYTICSLHASKSAKYRRVSNGH